jgi:cytochrome c-type biogenesis protein CcmF
MGNAPLFKRADYLSKIADGNGLNPLLQNYWMVIHPPTLFFGFATTIVPFAYAIAALWKRDYTGWLKPALPWGLVSVMVLGTGIIMGGFWAYESLSFGGYWAWDPVENASLIPWLILIAGVHVMLIYKHSGNALNVSFILILLTFILVLYATFLTRSGILGNSSVHSFTDLGMSGQLLVFIMIFLWLPAGNTQT